MRAIIEKDIDVLARTLWGEARGEGTAGMVAVAWAIRNRVDDGKKDSWWGEGYSGVCLKPYQFSCWNKNDPNYPYLSGKRKIPEREYALARSAAISVIEGRVQDPTNGATHYFTTSIKPPPWAAGATQTVRLGSHLFYKDVP